MFGDDRDKIEIDVERALETITVEDLLADNDLTIVQALAILVDEGSLSSQTSKRYSKRNYVAKAMLEDGDSLYRLRVLPHKNKVKPKKLRPQDVQAMTEEELDNINEQ